MYNSFPWFSSSVALHTVQTAPFRVAASVSISTAAAPAQWEDAKEPPTGHAANKNVIATLLPFIFPSRKPPVSFQPQSLRVMA